MSKSWKSVDWENLISAYVAMSMTVPLVTNESFIQISYTLFIKSPEKLGQ